MAVVRRRKTGVKRGGSYKGRHYSLAPPYALIIIIIVTTQLCHHRHRQKNSFPNINKSVRKERRHSLTGNPFDFYVQAHKALCVNQLGCSNNLKAENRKGIESSEQSSVYMAGGLPGWVGLGIRPP